MVYTGDLFAINNSLNGLYGWFDAHYNGQEHIVFTVSDLGSNGSGVAKTATYSFDEDIDPDYMGPVAVAGSDQSGVEGTPVHDGSGSYDVYNDPMTYTWDFGDGTQGTISISPAHTYANEGNYTVTLTVDDGDPNNEISINAAQCHRRNARRPGRFPAQPSACGTLSFTGTASDPGINDHLQIAWNFGDGSTSALRRRVIEYAQPHPRL